MVEYHTVTVLVDSQETHVGSLRDKEREKREGEKKRKGKREMEGEGSRETMPPFDLVC